MTKINKLVYLLLLELFLIPQAQAEWVDISPSVEITQSRQALDRVNRVLFSYVTIKNTSGVTIEAPLQLKIVDPNIPVVYADGLSEDFHSYIQLEDDILAGEERKIRVSFELARKRLSFGVQLAKEGYILQTGNGGFYNPPSHARYITEPRSDDNLFQTYVDGAFSISVTVGTTLSIVNEIAKSIDATIQGVSGNIYSLVISKPGLSFSEMLGTLSTLKKRAEVEIAVIELLVSFNSISADSDNSISADSESSGVIGENSSNQFYLKDAGIIGAWTYLKGLEKPIGGLSRPIGIIDSGLSKSHEDLDVEDTSPSNAPIFSLNPILDTDNASHGTFVTGIIAATHGNNNNKKRIGISGIMHQKRVLFVKSGALEGSEDTPETYLRHQIALLVEKGAKIINISMGERPVRAPRREENNDFPYCSVLAGYFSNNKTYPKFFIQKSKRKDCKYFKIDIDSDIPSPTLQEVALDQLNGKGLYHDFPEISVQFIHDRRLIQQLNVNGGAALLVKELEKSKNKDVLFIQSSGNYNGHSDGNGLFCSFTSDTSLKKQSLCVSALADSKLLKLADFSNYGGTDVITYGENILSTTLGGSKYGDDNGTSFSAPIVTGIAGLVWNAYPALTASQVRESIVKGNAISAANPSKCARPNNEKRLMVDDPSQENNSIPVANAFCALEYAEELDKQRLIPKNLQPIGKDKEIELSWSTVEGATTYNLYYSKTPSISKETAQKVSNIKSPYVLSGLTNGTTYYLAVTAIGGSGESDFSNEVSATPKPDVQNPINFDISQISVGSNHACALGEKEVYCWGDDIPKFTNFNLNNNPSYVVAGSDYTCVLDDPYVWCLGDGIYGANTEFQNVRQLSSGYNHACLIDDLGVHCWGDNAFGRTAVPVDLLNPRQVSAGFFHTCAIDDTGVRCWGRNFDGQLNVPVNLQSPRQVSSGSFHTCALDVIGIHCWGSNDFGRTDVPADLLNPRQVSAGGSHTCAIDDTGVRCWGSNNHCQLNVPTDLKNPRQISVGVNGFYTCALDDAGVHCWGYKAIDIPVDLQYLREVSVANDVTCVIDSTDIRCWGDNYSGQADVPTDLQNPRQVSAGDGHTCVFDDTGLRCWGANYAGQVDVPANLQNPRQVSAGDSHTCAIDDTGVRCWGDNSMGQADAPVDLQNPRQVSARNRHTCAIDDTGVRCWGDNSGGQADVPVNLQNPREVSAGSFHTCAIDATGLSCWGNNSEGQADVPANLQNPRQVSARGFHTCAIDDMGVHCWGSNKYGQIDNVPTDLKNPRKISSSSTHTCVIDDAGIHCWGKGKSNFYTF